MAGFGVDHRDDPFGGHTLGDARAALPVVFDVLGRDDLSAGQERHGASERKARRPLVRIRLAFSNYPGVIG